MKRLSGKVAIVFGAGPNIGGTVARFLAREDARVTVADLDLSTAQATTAVIAADGGNAFALSGDASDEASVAQIVAATVAHFGRLDIVFNMAGTIHWSPVVDMDLTAWREAVLSFPTAGMLTTKHAARAMIESGTRGSIIHLLSTAAHFGEASGSAYSAAKAALLNFARSAAMDLAHDGIRVNTITPCAMEHNLWLYMRDELVDPAFTRPATRSFYSRDEYLKMIPLERFPRATDIAWAAVFLASDESSFLTGVDLPVDGGLRFKYPTWTPGNFTGVNVADYAAQLQVTEYGEPTRTFLEPKKAQ